MANLKKSTKKVVVSLVGFPIIILGIILIPLPGPGILVVILGLFILSTEFDWANRNLEKAKDMQRKAMEKARAQRENVKNKNTEPTQINKKAKP